MRDFEPNVSPFMPGEEDGYYRKVGDKHVYRRDHKDWPDEAAYRKAMTKQYINRFLDSPITLRKIFTFVGVASLIWFLLYLNTT